MVPYASGWQTFAWLQWNWPPSKPHGRVDRRSSGTNYGGGNIHQPVISWPAWQGASLYCHPSIWPIKRGRHMSTKETLGGTQGKCIKTISTIRAKAVWNFTSELCFFVLEWHVLGVPVGFTLSCFGQKNPNNCSNPQCKSSQASHHPSFSPRHPARALSEVKTKWQEKTDVAKSGVLWSFLLTIPVKQISSLLPAPHPHSFKSLSALLEVPWQETTLELSLLNYCVAKEYVLLPLTQHLVVYLQVIQISKNIYSFSYSKTQPFCENQLFQSPVISSLTLTPFGVSRHRIWVSCSVHCNTTLFPYRLFTILAVPGRQNYFHLGSSGTPLLWSHQFQFAVLRSLVVDRWR